MDEKMINGPVEEITLIHVVKDMKRQIAELADEVAGLQKDVHDLRQEKRNPLQASDYETLYQEVMRRAARDLRFNVR